jgi:hypothetical protein
MKWGGVQDQAFKDFRYAKIQGRIDVSPGKVAFRLYYNPRAGDRRLAFDLRNNLLRPAPSATPEERESLLTFEP